MKPWIRHLALCCRLALGCVSGVFCWSLPPTGFAAQPPTFTTHHDTIPNFAQAPTIQSAQAGNWSNASTWSPARLPTTSDVVLISHTVTYDTTLGDVLTVGIDAGGVLRFRTDIPTRLRVANLLVMPQGMLEVGTAAAPVLPAVTAEIVIKDQPLDTTNDGIGVFDPEQFGTSLISVNATVRMQGAARTPTFVRLAQEPRAGATVLITAQPVTGWRPGDRLILPDTRHNAPTPKQWEELTLAAVSGTMLTLTAPLQYDHPGARDGNGVLVFLPHVGNLSRNVIIRSENPAGTRGHTVHMHRSDVDLRYVLFKDLGRTRYDPLDNTTFDAQGNVTKIGTNQIARYPLHAHHLAGPTLPQPSGYQFTLVGNAIDGGSVDHKFKWGITIHASHYGLIQHNVVYNMGGSGIAAEDGSESFDVFERNFVVRVAGTGQRPDARGANTTDLGFEGTGFWFRGPNNYVRDNVAADTPADYGYDIYAAFVGNRKIPSTQGKDPNHTGEFITVDMNAIPLREFARNEAYGGSKGGMTYWWLGTAGQGGPSSASLGAGTIADFTAWHTSTGIFGYQSYKLVIDGPVIIGDASRVSQQLTQGMEFQDYLQKQLTIKNATIHNMRIGINTPIIVDIRNSSLVGEAIIQDSVLKNYINVQMVTPWHNNNVVNLSGRRTILRNMTFASMAMATVSALGPQRAIKMWYRPQTISHLVAGDEVLVYAYNQSASQNFRVYYAEQQPTFIVPQTTYRADGTPQMIGSLDAGLTNQQNWATYGIAIGGAIAPCLDAATHPEIQGYTCALSAVPAPRGDVDRDGDVDLDDVRAMIFMLTGTRPPDLATADLDGDGQVALADLQLLVKILVGIP